ncbi:MAG TPA: sigma-70 family RNA polymerase sigma factor [Candidatus Dormibacteraeota bacterium]|nr:sigma-70 family RNA polymerase sigma factor [Candidatus Dormibacteraeota bacterium]
MDEREAAIRALLPMIRSLSRSVAFKVPSCEQEDLASEGAIGAIRAVDTFDPGRGVPLRAYARKLVYGAMLNGVRRMDAVPEHVRREARIAERVRYEIYARGGRDPRFEEIAAAAGLDAARLDEDLRRAAAITALSLDEPLPPGLREPADHEEPTVILCRRERNRQLTQALRALPERERYVVVQHYFRRATFEVLGRRMGVSRQRASQIHLQALRRLRRRLAGALAA